MSKELTGELQRLSSAVSYCLTLPALHLPFNHVDPAGLVHQSGPLDGVSDAQRAVRRREAPLDRPDVRRDKPAGSGHSGQLSRADQSQGCKVKVCTFQLSGFQPPEHICSRLSTKCLVNKGGPNPKGMVGTPNA